MNYEAHEMQTDIHNNGIRMIDVNIQTNITNKKTFQSLIIIVNLHAELVLKKNDCLAENRSKSQMCFVLYIMRLFNNQII